MDLEVGTNCVYYSHADTKQEPEAAVVVKTNGKGVLYLTCFPSGGGMSSLHRNVHHVDSSILKEKTGLAINYGGWDTIENAEKRRKASLEKADERAAKLAKLEEEKREKDLALAKQLRLEERVWKLYDKGLTHAEIASDMGSGWTVAKVRAVLDKTVEASV
tara:strand:- start:571 stop:1053 length:483 start_codon:yes stop_codon:yes gene_type:complete